MLRHAPLQQIHAVNTEQPLLCTEPASTPLNSSVWIHFSLPRSYCAWLSQPCIQRYFYAIRYLTVPHTSLLSSFTLALGTEG